jgi:hypothetical protein
MARSKSERGRGQPKKEIDLGQLQKLAALQATYEELAFFFDCEKRTIINRLKEPALKLAYENGKAGGRLSLRRLQWRHANGTGSSAVNMTIHMSKQKHWLNETDKVSAELTGKGGGPIEHKDVSPRELITSRIAGIAARKRAGDDSGGPERQPA